MKTVTTNTGRQATTLQELKSALGNSKVQKLLFAVGCITLYMQLRYRQNTLQSQKCEKQYAKQLTHLKAHNLKAIEELYGERCKTKDYEDFPELEPLFPIGDPDAGRCPVCLVYEKFDAYWKYLA